MFMLNIPKYQNKHKCWYIVMLNTHFLKKENNFFCKPQFP